VPRCALALKPIENRFAVVQVCELCVFPAG
jgi:hypothetical protein